MRPRTLVKPSHMARINRGHPLAQGLAHAYLLDEAGGQTLNDRGFTNPTKLTKSSTNVPWGATPYGTGWVVAAAATNNLYTATITAGQTDFCAWPMTDVVLVLTNATPAANTSAISVGGASHGCQFQQQTSGKLFYKVQSSGGQSSAQSTAAMAVGTYASWAGTVSSSGAMAIYHNGVQEGTASLIGTFDTGSTSVTLGAQTSGGSGNWNGGIVYWLHYTRALSPAEVRWLYEDPFCILEPLRAPLYLPLMNQNFSRSISSSVASSTSVSRQTGASRSTSNSVANATDVARTLALVRATSDSTPSTTSTVRTTAASRTVSDSVPSSSSVDRTTGANRVTSDAVDSTTSASRSLGLSRSTSDSVDVTSTTSRSVGLSRAISNSIPASSSTSARLTFGRAISSAIACTTSVLSAKGKLRTISSAIDITTAVSRSVGLTRTIVDSVAHTSGATALTAVGRLITSAIAHAVTWRAGRLPGYGVTADVPVPSVEDVQVGGGSGADARVVAQDGEISIRGGGSTGGGP